MHWIAIVNCCVSRTNFQANTWTLVSFLDESGDLKKIFWFLKGLQHFLTLGKAPLDNTNLPSCEFFRNESDLTKSTEDKAFWATLCSSEVEGWNKHKGGPLKRGKTEGRPPSDGAPPGLSQQRAASHQLGRTSQVTHQEHLRKRTDKRQQK